MEKIIQKFTTIFRLEIQIINTSTSNAINRIISGITGISQIEMAKGMVKTDSIRVIMVSFIMALIKLIKMTKEPMTKRLT